VLLRIDDLDGERCRPEFVERSLVDLEWLGLDWDGPVYFESAGQSTMNRALRELVERGLAYACTCSRGDVLSAQSAPQAGASEPRYPGTCRDRYDSPEAAERASGRAPVIRLRVPEGVVPISDGLFREQAFDVQSEVGDFMIGRRDGAPAYQLAVVVDDALQGVTEVVRGSDLLPSSARQTLVARALSLPLPSYFHVPLVTDEAGRRLAKRARDLGLAELRERGVDPRAIVGWCARSAGLSAPERASPAEVLAAFDPKRLAREPAALAPAEIERWRR
jgi:glutamyl-tRNA synthetase